MKRPACSIARVVSLLFLFVSHCLYAENLSFSARLVNSDGSPVAGPVELSFELAYSSDTSDILCSKDLSDVALSSGVFHANLEFGTDECVNSKELAQVLQETPSGESLMMRVVDETDSANPKTYPFQALNTVPMSVMSEVSKTLSQMGATSGQVLRWNGTEWGPENDDGEPGTVTQIITGAGLEGGPIENSGTIYVDSEGIIETMLAPDSVTSAKIDDGTIQNADIADGEIKYIKLNIGAGKIPNDRVNGLGSAALADIGTSAGMVMGADAVPNCAANQKLQMSLGPTFSWSCVDDSTATDNTKLPLAGGTMSGTINMNGNAIENLQTPLLDGDAATKKYVDDGLSLKADSTELSNYVAKAGDNMTGALQLDAQNELRLADSDSTNYVALRSNATVAASFILTLPNSAGSADQVLTTDGTGVLTWSTPSTTATPEGSAGGELAGTYPNPLIADGVIDDANVMVGANIGAAKVGTGVVDNTEFNTLDGVTSSIQTQLNNKENSVTAGTTAQYRRGDKSWQILDTSVVPENGNLYYTTTRVRTDAVDDAIVDAVVDVAPSQNAVFDALALKADASSLDNYVLKAGDTMTGALNLPVDGLAVGTDQLIATGGNVGIGTTNPAGSKLKIRDLGDSNNVLLELDSSTGLSGGQTGTFYGLKADIKPNNNATDGYGIYVDIIPGTSVTEGVYAKSSQGSSNRKAIGIHGLAVVNSAATGQDPIGGDPIAGVLAEAEVTNTGTESNTAALVANNKSNYGAKSYGAFINTVAGPTDIYPLFVAHSGNNLLTVRDSGNVGVGTTTPGTKLEVAGQVKITGGAPAAGRVLSSDATGLASWVDLPSSNTPSGAAGGELSGTYPDPTIADGVIDNANVMVGANVDAAKLGTGLVDNTEFNYLDGVTSSIQTQLDGKEGTITAGTTAQYWRGDKSWQTLDTSVVPENTNLYYTTTRARTDAVNDAIVDAVVDVAPSQNAVFDALALKADQSSLSNYVLKAGDTMTGALNLPADGLVVGTSQLVTTGGNVGIGVATPTQALEVNGNIAINDANVGTFYSVLEIPWASTTSDNVLLLLGRSNAFDQSVSGVLRSITRNGVGRRVLHSTDLSFNINDAGATDLSLIQHGRTHSGSLPELVTFDYNGATWYGVQFTSWNADIAYFSGVDNSSDGLQTILSSSAANIAPYQPNNTFQAQTGHAEFSGNVDVKGDLSLGNANSTCSSTNEGALRYNTTGKYMEYCDGSLWKGVSDKKETPTLYSDQIVTGSAACGTNLPGMNFYGESGQRVEVTVTHNGRPVIDTSGGHFYNNLYLNGTKVDSAGTFTKSTWRSQVTSNYSGVLGSTGTHNVYVHLDCGNGTTAVSDSGNATEWPNGGLHYQVWVMD